ncbi:hypothetical protein B0H13DRAFT_2017493 [Mycena leptocephala]|nr:hypothetical protein B0H13DRAFT_2017493 [Mycena leptocephala]
MRQWGALSSGRRGLSGPSVVSNYGGSSASQSNYSVSSTNYPSTPPRPAHTYTLSSSPSNAYNLTSTTCSITPHSTSSSISVHNTPTLGPMPPRTLYAYRSSCDWDSQSGESMADEEHRGTLHTYLVLVPSLPSLLLMPLLCRARFICLPLRSNFH